jgi:hypothetical protein
MFAIFALTNARLTATMAAPNLQGKEDSKALRELVKENVDVLFACLVTPVEAR